MTDFVSTDRGLRHLWAGSKTNLWAAGDQDALFHWDGTTWSDMPHPPIGNIGGVWGASPTEVWVAGRNGLLRWDGSTFTPVLIPGLAPPLTAVGGSSATDVWVAGKTSVARWDGAAWTLTPLPAGEVAFYLCLNEPGHPWLGTYSGVLELTPAGWMKAAEIPSGQGASPARVFCDGRGQLRALAGKPRRSLLRFVE